PVGDARPTRRPHRRQGPRPLVRLWSGGTGGRAMSVRSSELSQPRELSRRAAAMPRSAIREIMALAASRPDVIHLEVGEPDFITPEHIIDAAFAQVRAGANKYTGNAGRPE